MFQAAGESKERFFGEFKVRRRVYILLGLFLIVVFLNLIYLGYSGGLDRFGIIGKKKEVEQASLAISCNATANVSWPSYPNCKVAKALSWPYKVLVYDPLNTCGGLCPAVNTDSSSATYSASGLTPDKEYQWVVCWPECNKTGNYQIQRKQRADSGGKLSFSWSALTFKVYIYDKNCSLKCPAPATPASVASTSKTFSNLWPSRAYTYAICWPDCNQNRAEKRGEFTTGACSGTGQVSYSVILFKPDGQLVNARHDLTSTSYTFSNLEPRKQYDAFVYTPTRSFGSIYWSSRVTSGQGACNWTEDEMQTAIQYLVNENRRTRGKSNLNVNPSLVTTARIRSQENDCLNAINHTRPGADCRLGTSDDSAWYTVLDAYGLSGASSEIIARNNVVDDLESVKRAMTDWMNSTGHRDIILSSDYTEMGAGVIDSSDGFKYFTVHFRKP